MRTDDPIAIQKLEDYEKSQLNKPGVRRRRLKLFSMAIEPLLNFGLMCLLGQTVMLVLK